MKMLKFELKLMLSGIANKLAIGLFILASLASIYFGVQGYKNLVVDQLKSEYVFKKEVDYVKNTPPFPEIGSMAYYAFSPTKWALSPWAALFVGQSQDNFVAIKVRALALQGQIYNREINNPNQQKAGRLDFSFVVIYLLPILIGILTVTLVTDELHENRWRMLQSLPQGGNKLLWYRFALRFVFVTVLLTLLLFSAALLLKLPFDLTYFWVLSAIIIYASLWFTLAAIIASFAKSSVFASLAFICIWLITSILIPGVIQIYLDQKYFTIHSVQASLNQRIEMNDGWDKDKQATVDSFLALYPEYQSTRKLGEAFDWKWYYAQQHMSDIKVDSLWQTHVNIQKQRSESLKALSVFSPNLYFQLLLNKTANTDSNSSLDYLLSVKDYHQQIREFIYPYLFMEQAFTEKDLALFPKFSAKTKDLTPSFIPLLVLLTLLSSIVISLNRLFNRELFLR